MQDLDINVTFDINENYVCNGTVQAKLFERPCFFSSFSRQFLFSRHSLFVLQGDYDDILAWPFRQKVTLMLVDQKHNRRHLSDTFRPDPTSTSFQKPTMPMNVASGCPLFVEQKVLEDERDGLYLQNDTIFIKVIVDTSDLLNP